MKNAREEYKNVSSVHWIEQSVKILPGNFFIIKIIDKQ